MKLSQNFSLKELTFSHVAELYDIANEPNNEQIEHLKALCINVLQPARDEFGKQIIVNSGFRCRELNTKIDGAVKSQHLEGKAADITSIDNNKLFNILLKQCNFDQLIAEGLKNGKPKWIHVSFNGQNNRKQVLIAQFKDRKADYMAFYPELYNKIYTL
jgi:zinc D-Ala-D-Ala carboxypeptidase